MHYPKGGVCVRALRAMYTLNSTTRARPDVRGPARTLSETRTDQRSFSEIRVVRVRAGPRGSGRARVVEFSYMYVRQWLGVSWAVGRSVGVSVNICSRADASIAARDSFRRRRSRRLTYSICKRDKSD